MTPFELDPQISLIDMTVAVPKRRVLALADVHLGFEEALHRDGTLVPRGHLTTIQTRLQQTADTLGISPERPWARILVNGDLRHGFGPFTSGERTHIRGFLDRLSELAETVTLIQGNHDGNLNVLTSQFQNVNVAATCQIGGMLFLHGDAEPAEIPPDVDTLVIGHDHPAVRLRDPVTGRMELFKCFLTGVYEGRRLIVVPSFNPWTAGSDLTQEEPLSPLLNRIDLASMAVYLISDEREIFPFGKLGRLTAHDVTS